MTPSECCSSGADTCFLVAWETTTAQVEVRRHNGKGKVLAWGEFSTWSCPHNGGEDTQRRGVGSC